MNGQAPFSKYIVLLTPKVYSLIDAKRLKLNLKLEFSFNFQVYFRIR